MTSVRQYTYRQTSPRRSVSNVPFEETPRTAVNFSFRDPEESDEYNRKAINFADDYRLDARL